MLEQFHCHLWLWILDKWYSPPAQQCEIICVYSIQEFLAKELSVPFHMHCIIPDLFPRIFSSLPQPTQALKSHTYENTEAVKIYNSATVQYTRKCLLWPLQYHSEVPSCYQCSWTIFKLHCMTMTMITIL